MAAGVEVGTAYLSIVAATGGMRGDIADAFGAAEGEGGKAGTKSGRGFAANVGAVLKSAGKKTLIGAAAGAGAVAGTALYGGIRRALSIEGAKAKLTGLGHDAESMSVIMDNALASVRGTSFGLGEAATTAAGAVAAGIKPGEDLERVLKSTANAAAAAGVDMGEMGGIYNKVASLGKAQNDSLQQVADRGIPIYQALADQMGASAEEVFKMASRGEISFQAFEKAMTSASGTVAEEMGTTLTGTLANVNAALGRLGAAVVTPVFEALTPVLASLIPVIDGATEAAKPLGEWLGKKLADGASTLSEHLPGLIDRAKELWDTFSDSGVLDIVIGPLGNLGGVLADLAPSLLLLGESLAKGAGAASVTLWTALGVAIQTVAGVLQIATPLIEALAKFLAENQEVAMALGVAAGLLKIYTLAAKGVAAIMALNPATLWIAGIVALVSVLFWAYKNVDWFRNGVDKVWAGIKAGGAVALGWLQTLPGRISEWFGGMVENARTKGNEIITWFQELPARILSAVTGLGERVAGIGRDIITGLMNGIKEKGGDLVKGVKDTVGGAIQGVKDFLGIQSPSRVFMEIGRFSGEGLTVGLDAESTSVAKAAEQLAAAAVPKPVQGDAAAQAAAEAARRKAAAAVGASMSAGVQSAPTIDTQAMTTVNAQQLAVLRALLAATEAGKEINLDGRELVGQTARRMSQALAASRSAEARAGGAGSVVTV